MLTTEKVKLTYQDYAKLPENAPYQLIDGELVMSPAPTRNHQQIAKNIFRKLDRFVEISKMGEVYFAPLDVLFGDTETFQPDIIYISKENKSLMKEENIIGAPDLIVEILSPSTAYYDLKHKKNIYELSGVKEYWIVDPMEKTVEIFFNENKKYTLIGNYSKTETCKSKLLTGFEISLTEIF